MSIGGNIKAIIQTSAVSENAIGEQVKSWTDRHSLKGWLDAAGGSSNYVTYSAKVLESSHVFLCDYMKLDDGIKAENSRMVIEGNVYDVMFIDDPMNMHVQLEIFLKYTGGL